LPRHVPAVTESAAPPRPTFVTGVPEPARHSPGAGNGQAAAPNANFGSVLRKVQTGFVLALACVAIIGIVSYLSVVRLNGNTARVQHTDEVLTRLELLLAAATDSETAERGYVITGDETYLLPYLRGAQTIDLQEQRLRQLIDNPQQRARLETAIGLVGERLASLHTVLELRRAQGFAAAQAEILTGKGKAFHDRVRRIIDDMKVSETSLLQQREAAAQRSATATEVIIVVGGLLAFAIVALALWLIRRDFAGRARAEQALRHATDELARFFALSLDFLCIASADGYFKRVSPAVTDILGWSTEEFLSRPFLEYVHPDDHARTLKEVERQVVAGEKVLQFENRYRHKDGSWRVLSWHSMPQPGGLMYATARDVTELKRVEATLREAKELLEVRVQQRTAALEQSTRALETEVSERREAQRRLQAQLQRLGLLNHITRAIGERQDTRSILQVVVRTVEEQLPTDFCCACQYESEAKELTVTSVGLRSATLARELAMDEHSRIEIDSNGLAQSVRGRLVYEPDLARVPFPFAQRLARGGLSALVAAPLLVESKVFGVLIAARQAGVFSSGECEFLQQLSGHVALAAHQAELYGALQRAYDDLRQTQKAVLQQERLLALGQMASGIAHDINNAISPVSLYTESLLETEPNLSPRARGYLETIQRAIDDVAQTVARMREFYRTREQQLTLLPVDLNQLVPQVVELTRARWSDMAQRRGVSIEMHTELSPELPAIMGAEGEIREALTNLIFNAVDAMPEGGVLTVRTRSTSEPSTEPGEPPNKFVHLEVADTGLGMDEDTRRRCLEPFFTTKGERGTGLGLAMVYGAIQRHSADIDIESGVGHGTTVRLSFAVPATAAVLPAVAMPAAAAVALRILLIDDDPLVIKSLRDTLESEGHKVTAADGGQAGIDAFLSAQAQGSPFPVVITDLGMPYVDGRKVSAAIKAAAASTLVLMLTGWGQRLVADADTPPHVDRVLSKPPKLRELREALTQYAERRSA
jgi:PAS domain S-box-containing protein